MASSNTAKKKAPAKSGGSTKSKAKSAAKTPPKTTAKRPSSGTGRVVAAAVCIIVGLLCVIGYFPVEALFIRSFCGLIRGLIGYGFYVFPPALLAAGVLLLRYRKKPMTARTVCLLLAPVALGALFHVLFAAGMKPGSAGFGDFLAGLYESGRSYRSGGALAGTLGWGCRSLFSVYGAAPLLLFALIALGMAAFAVTPTMLAQRLAASRARRYEPEPLEDEDEDDEPDPAPLRRRQDAPAVRRASKPTRTALEPVLAPSGRHARHAIDIRVDDEPPQEPPEAEMEGFFNKRPRVQTPAELLEGREASPAKARPEPQSEAQPQPIHSSSKAAVPAAQPKTPAVPPIPSAPPEVEPLSMEDAAKLAGVDLTPKQPEAVHTEEFTTAEVREKRSASRKTLDAETIQQETEAVAKAVEQKNAEAAETAPVYRFPPVELLQRGPGSSVDGREEMHINAERLQRTLDSFGVGATLADITRGPTVTRYDLELDTGVRLNKLTNLAGDIALSLGVSGVRIAPIEGRSSTVGIEVPNKIVSTVYLRDIIDTETFRRASSRLTFALGKDISGEAICGNIAKLPHLLIAGTTGSGKSVCMNCLILSLLYKSTPEEVRLIMIDPKMVELGIYNGIPHLYVPVVTDPKKAAGSLQWSVVEMLKRYRLFSEVGVRDLAGYNAIQKKNAQPTLPQVVIIIDELADLMMVASKEVEESICRVAQMGRAAGMHLVIATQRPSADVITGLMKANIPSRIAFAVSSAMESRIILDQMGAEKLVGHGDMLYAPIGTGKPPRIQGAFVSDEEREEIVSFIKSQGEARYSDEIISSIEAAAAEKDKDKSAANAKAESVEEPETGVYDELLPQAVDVIFETKQASVSMLQRRLKLGYSRAARIVDQMEEIGVVGPFEGSKPRQILLTREQWLEMQTIHGTAPTEQLPQQTSFADYEDAPPETWEDG